MANKLYVVPTPIGNLQDISIRSIEILKSVNFILCEDTKNTGKIKSHFNLKAKLISLHKFNEKSRLIEIENLLSDYDVALVSDAGTPTISDPGQILVNHLKSLNFEIVPLPGPNAITTALSGSGLKFDTFSFVGFLEKEKSKIIEKIKLHQNSDVIVCYESPKRIIKTLSILKNEFGDISIVIARELTKIYEEIIFDKISNLESKIYKGEIVIIIPTEKISLKSNLEIHIEKLLKLGLDKKSIIDYLTFENLFRKNEIYDYFKKKYN